MTDRELLEAAAKAAGYEIADFEEPGVFERIIEGIRAGNEWNPLESNGDAFSLAVKLGLFLDCDSQSAMDTAKTGWNRDDWCNGYDSSANKDDDNAMMRCAIVRAAAAMAKEPV